MTALEGGSQPELGRRVAVVSPHLDDAVLSLGAAIVRAARRGSRVSVVTVFAGDPASITPADAWGRRCGFSTSGEMYRARRAEDRAALASLGAEPRWLPFDVDAGNGEIAASLKQVLAEFDSVLVPGSPCTHPDHVRVARLVLDGRPEARVGFYVDQPYAMWRLLGTPPLAGDGRAANLAGLVLRRSATRALQRPQLPPELAQRAGNVAWRPVDRSARELAAKLGAVYHYRSQLRGFGPITVPGVLLYEAAAGGEAVGWERR